MAASTLLATRDALKRYLGIAPSDSSQDGLLDQLLAYASERIESHCRRRFAEEELEELYDGSGTDLLVLRRRPVISLGAVYEDPEGEFGEGTRLPESEFALYAQEGIVRHVGAIFPCGRLNVKIVYTAGYRAIPDDVALACVKLAASWYAHAGSGADGVTRESLGDYAAEYDRAALPRDVESALAPYRELAAG